MHMLLPGVIQGEVSLLAKDQPGRPELKCIQAEALHQHASAPPYSMFLLGLLCETYLLGLFTTLCLPPLEWKSSHLIRLLHSVISINHNA